MRICVTGGAGFIGVHLVAKFLSQGAEILVLDDFSTSDPSRVPRDPRIRVERIDIRDEPRLSRKLQAFSPSVLIHLAARHFIPYCDAHPVETMDVNVRGTIALMRSASARSVSHFILASSLAVYPPSTRLHREQDEPGPIDIYGYSKWIAELVCEQWTPRLGSRVSIFRIANVYGDLETNPHVVPRILAQLHQGDSLELGNLESRRDYIHIRDVVAAFSSLVDPTPPASPKLETLNLSTGKDASVRELIAHIESILGRKIVVQSSKDLIRPVDRPVLRGDPSRLRTATGWSPSLSLRDGLRALLVSEGLA